MKRKRMLKTVWAAVFCLGLAGMAALSFWQINPGSAAVVSGEYSVAMICELTKENARSGSGTNLLLYVDSDLTAHDAKGNAVAPLADIPLYGRVPVYHIQNSETAAALAAYLTQNPIAGAIVASRDASLVKAFKSLYPSARTMVDFRAHGDLGDPVAVRDAVNTAKANIALLADRTGKDFVRSLRRLLVTVWVSAEDGVGIGRAVASGADGICVKDMDAFNAVAAQLPDKVLSDMPFIIAHRGNSGIARDEGVYHENTVEASWAAYRECGADIIELDVYVTTDYRLVVMHDATLQRTTTGTGYVEQMSLAEIRQYKAGRAGETVLDEIPTLDDYYDTFKGEDVVLFIELKTSHPLALDLIYNLTKAKQMSGQIAFISFGQAMLTRAAELMPEVSRGYLTATVNDTAATAAYLNTHSFTLNPSYGAVTAPRAIEFGAYGIGVWPWTLNDNFKDALHGGYSGITTDYAMYAMGWFKCVYTPFDAYTCAVGTDFSIHAAGRFYDGSETDIDCRLIPLDDGLPLIKTGKGRFKAESTGEGTFLAVYAEENGLTVNLIGTIVVVTCTDQAAGCKSQSAAHSAVVCTVCLAAIAPLLLRGRKFCRVKM